ncbi:TetR/AcrR family transcriptional regulator [Kribbella sp. CA-294648]|uniref:TetR/AcrR family transcriptional regulator n=1 Tax=Kribbella sp. CA-294648 TaxID=3239948 RepID=UPI003D8F828C
MRLSRDDWARAGLELLAEEGLAGLAVEPLARRLGTTKGSFYWHFKDRDDLIQAALERWEADDTTAVIASAAAVEDPRKRLDALADRALGDALRLGFDAAILAAAGDPRVQPVLVRVTRTRMEFIVQMYRDLGLSKRDAERHARLTYSLFLGMSQLRIAEGARRPSPAEVRRSVGHAVHMLLSSAGLD